MFGDEQETKKDIAARTKIFVEKNTGRLYINESCDSNVLDKSFGKLHRHEQSSHVQKNPDCADSKRISSRGESCRIPADQGSGNENECQVAFAN